MARLLPFFWLPGAVLYTAGTLLLVQPPTGDGSPSQSPSNETIKAKQPPAVVEEGPAKPAANAPHPFASEKGESSPADTVIAGLPPLPRPEPRALRPGQWVEVVDYTAVVRSQPAVSASVLAGSPVGQAFRVIARDGGFARVQDLGSGQLGWIRETSLAPYMGGYRQRRVATATQMAAAPQILTVPQMTEAPQVAAATPQRPDALSQRRGREPFALAPSTAAEPGGSAIDTNAREQPVLVAQRDSLNSIMQRAFSGR